MLLSILVFGIWVQTDFDSNQITQNELNISCYFRIFRRVYLLFDKYPTSTHYFLFGHF